MKLWAGRFQKETDTLVNTFNSSIDFDARLYKQVGDREDCLLQSSGNSQH